MTSLFATARNDCTDWALWAAARGDAAAVVQLGARYG
jgi:hypothetical protein